MGLSILAAIVGTYGAIVATLALVWQIYSWRHPHPTRVGVSVESAWVEGELPEGVVPAATPAMRWAQRFRESLQVDVINYNDHPIYVHSVQIEPQESDGGEATIYPRKKEDPDVSVRPHDRHVFYCDPRLIDADRWHRPTHDLRGIDLMSPITARVTLADGQVFRSRPAWLRGAPSGWSSPRRSASDDWI